ncbi:hypothetical protein DIPPA_25075 [Diplonema papillatum]|nr:hypothetical protein DIPPA_25075 [Diplonema papillatum]
MDASKKRDIEKDTVFLGLQQRKKCALCLQTFDVEELPGAISHNSIRELRRKWGVGVGKKPSPSKLYQREELCVFCMQFFDV